MMLRFASTDMGGSWLEQLKSGEQDPSRIVVKGIYSVGAQLNVHMLLPPLSDHLSKIAQPTKLESYSWNLSCKRPRPLIRTDCLMILHCF